MSTGQSWRFDSDELGVLRELLQLSQWPFPFVVRPVARMRDEQRARDRAAADRLATGGILRAGRLDDELAHTLSALVRPELGIDAFGFSGDGTGGIVRVLAGSRGRAGAVAVQLPGPDDEVGGDVLVRAVAPAELAATLVGALPAVPTGREAALHVAAADLRRPSATSVTRTVRVTPAEQARARLAALAQGPLHGTGQLAVSVARPVGPPLRRCTLRWLDRSGDGRYLLASDGDVRLRPAGPSVLTEELAAAVATALRLR